MAQRTSWSIHVNQATLKYVIDDQRYNLSFRSDN
jgi:hypothetical protein